MSATGSALISFGAFPGTGEASVVITGQTAITAESRTDAWLVCTSTTDYTIEDHAYAASLVTFSTGNIVAGTGFTIYGRCIHGGMQGTLSIQWAWA